MSFPALCYKHFSHLIKLARHKYPCRCWKPASVLSISTWAMVWKIQMICIKYLTKATETTWPLHIIYVQFLRKTCSASAKNEKIPISLYVILLVQSVSSRDIVTFRSSIASHSWFQWTKPQIPLVRLPSKTLLNTQQMWYISWKCAHW